MKKLLAAGATIAACLLTVGSATPAAADPPPATPGKIIVFSTEFQKLDTWEDPEGCQKLPIAAHVLVNDSDKVVRTFSDPLCLFPTLTVNPGHGAHVMPGTGSFSAGA